MNGFSLYFRFLNSNFLAGFQYKGWPIQVINVLIGLTAEPLTIFLLFSRFGQVGDWTMERLMLVYGMAVTSFGLAETFFPGV